MITYAMMTLIILFLIFELLYNSNYIVAGTHLFDKKNSTAMRGFWCLIVILVHIPAVYQNRIQDMLGSFAYIGVTFFFMTSAYGLKYGLSKNPSSIDHFWRQRLPKLMIPMFLVNILSMIFRLAWGKQISVSALININGWVQWLLVCYVIFWSINRFIKFEKTNVTVGGGYKDLIICVLISVFSITVYMLKSQSIGNLGSTWCPEIFGFVWGIIFFHIRKRFTEWLNNKWLLKCIILCMFAGIIGIAYLKYKSVYFFGDYLLKIILGVIIILFMLAVNNCIAIGNKVSLFLGNISYEVYLIHGVVFGLLEYAVPQLNSGIFIGLSIVITVVLSWVVSIASKPVIGILNKWTIG